jgi:AcrR family transcriptional regulator
LQKRIGLLGVVTMNDAKELISPRRELVREELLTKAAEVFEQKGFGQTRIEDIAKALGLKRSALYYYFETKNDIARALVEDYLSSKANDLEELVSSSSGSPTEKLRALLTQQILNRTSGGGARARALNKMGPELPDETRATLQSARRRIRDLYVQVIEEGIEAGEFRHVDARIAALAVIGIANWTSWWYSPGGRLEPSELAETLVDIAVNGLRRTDVDRAQGRSLKEIIAYIRRDLSELESRAESDATPDTAIGES